MKLHGYFRSSASYRVRIALNLKGIEYEGVPNHLVRGEQKAPDFMALNPQGLVPALELDDGRTALTQSLAICDYLDEICPEPPLLPSDPLRRAKVRAAALLIACEVHPVQNLGVLNRLRGLGLDGEQVQKWAADTIDEGLKAFSSLIADETGPYCFGAQVTLADLVLVPQLVNARRFKARIDWPRLPEIETACLALDAFRRAAPEAQPDYE